MTLLVPPLHETHFTSPSIYFQALRSNVDRFRASFHLNTYIYIHQWKQCFVYGNSPVCVYVNSKRTKNLISCL